MALLILCGLLVITMIINAVKPMPKGTDITGSAYNIPDDSVKFLCDVTYVDSKGKRVVEQEIFDEIFSMIKAAEKVIISDIFLINGFQGSKPENFRKLSSEFCNTLIKKKTDNPDIFISVTTDPINTQYGGVKSENFEAMKNAGIVVTITALEKLRDSVFLYSAFWRLFFQWMGNSDKGGLLPNLLAADDKKITVRSILRLLNLKANHRKLVITDAPSNKMSVLITSNNASDASSAHGNTAVRIDDSVWKDAIKSETGIAEFSGTKLDYKPGEVKDKTGTTQASFISEKAIKRELVKKIKASKKGSSIKVVMFYLSEQDIVKELAKAAKRGVDVRIILDPNKDSFGRQRDGTPNRPAANEIYELSDKLAKIRWYNTNGEQCHGKMFIFENSGSYSMIQGSCNMTRRNMDNLNLEADIMVESGKKTKFFDKAEGYFNRIWSNDDGNTYTADFEKYRDTRKLLRLKYKLQEMTGWCSF